MLHKQMNYADFSAIILSRMTRRESVYGENSNIYFPSLKFYYIITKTSAELLSRSLLYRLMEVFFICMIVRPLLNIFKILPRMK